MKYFPDLKLITIATDVTDGLRRYLRSVNKYGLDAEVWFTFSNTFSYAVKCAR